MRRPLRTSLTPAILPAIYCLWQPVVYGKAKRLALCCGSSLAIILVVALLHIGQILWITQYDTELGGLLQPWSYLVNTGRVISSQHDAQTEEIKLPDGHIADHEKAVVVLVIGESARKANFQLYGSASRLEKPTSNSTATIATRIRCCPDKQA